MYASNNGAFSNRIKCILSCMYIDSCSHILWIIDPKKVDSPFSHFFTNTEFTVISHPPPTETFNIPQYNSSRLSVLHHNLPLGFSKLKKDLTGKPYKDFPKNGKAIDHEYTHIPSEIQSVYRSLLKTLTIQPSVLIQVMNFLVHHDLTNGNFIAIHARTWNFKSLNHTPREAMRRKTINLAQLILYIETQIQLSQEKIFLTSDNQSILNHFSNNSKVVFRNLQDTFSPDSSNGFIDMLIASHAHTLHLTLHSTFSELIWWYNNNNPTVHFIDSSLSL